MIIRKYQFIALALLGSCLSFLPSCGGPSTGIQSYNPIAAPAAGTARVWFLRTRDPQEQFGDPIIYANGNAVGRSVPDIAFYHDFPPGAYAFTVQSYGIPNNFKDRVQLVPGTETYLEVLWGGSWLEGVPGGATFFVRTLNPQVGEAYARMMRDHGPPQAL
jgi:hypothetical protein